jgi:hypothetical protein
MAQKPEDRYASAGEFREALRRMGRTNSAIGIVSKATPKSENPSAQPAETPALKMAMVVSARRFGPGAATAVLVVLLMVAAGIFYGSQGWFDAPRAVAEAAPATSPVQRQPAAARKPERPRSTDSSGVTVAKTKNVSEVMPERVSEKGNEVAVQKSQTVYVRKQEPPATEERKSRRVVAPNVRLPNVDFRENLPAPSPQPRTRSYGSSNAADSSRAADSSIAAPKFFRAADGTGMVKFSDGSISRIRTYGSSSAADSPSGAPKFFRAADGTRIVKFSDGSVRVLHPGERSARSDVYRQH